MKMNKKILSGFPGKLDFAIGIIFGYCLMIAYRVGLNVEEKWPYVLLLLLSIVVYKISNDSLFMKMVAVINILYSVFMFVQQLFESGWPYNLDENTQTVIGTILFVFIILGNMMATVSGIFVLFFGIIIGVCWRVVLYMVFGMPGFIATFFLAKIRGPIPDVQYIAKREKSVYLQKDYRKKQVQLIYRQGSKRKVLDTYDWDVFQTIQYSLKKESTNGVIVQKYCMKTFKLIEEKEYTVRL